MFKKTYFYLAILLLSVSCKKDIIGFDMIYQNRITINAGLNPIEIHNFIINEIATDTAVFFSTYGKGSKDIKTILPKTFTIIENSFGVPLSFITRAELIISSRTNTTIKPTVIYYRDDVLVSNGTTLDLIPNNIDLRPFIYDGRYDLRLRLWLRDVPTLSINPDVKWSFLAQTN